MKKFFIALAIVATCVAQSVYSVAYAADKLENIPLEWAPTSPMSERNPVELSGLEGVKLQIEPFTDRREDPALIGRNVNKVPIRKVTTKEDVKPKRSHSD